MPATIVVVAPRDPQPYSPNNRSGNRADDGDFYIRSSNPYEGPPEDMRGVICGLKWAVGFGLARKWAKHCLLTRGGTNIRENRVDLLGLGTDG
jgi:hypothetical protein